MWSYRKEIHKIHAVPLVVDPPCTSGIDLAFIIDYTGSMGTVIEEVKTSAIGIANTVSNLSDPGNYRLALVISDEEDKGVTPNYFSSVEYNALPISQRAVRTDGPTTDQYTTAMEVFGTLNNVSEFTTQLNKINDPVNFPLGYGVGGPEPLDEALSLILNEGFINNFKLNVARYILIFTDAQPSGNDDLYDSIDDARIAALTQVCITKGIKVIVLGSGAAYPVYQDLATNTGGSFNLSFNGAVVESELTAGCGNLQTPTALAGQDRAIFLSANTINLNGTPSFDSDGTITNYLWELESGPTGSTITNPTSATTTVTGIAVGAYIFKLTVTDNDGLQDTDTVLIQVNPTVVMTSYSYEGFYELNDPAHPNGGSLNYVDINGNTQSLTFMWVGNCQTFSSQSGPTNVIGAGPCTPAFTSQMSNSTATSNCAGAGVTTYPIQFTTQDSPIIVGSIIYQGGSTSNVFIGDGTWYSTSATFSMRIGANGVVTEVDISCVAPQNNITVISLGGYMQPCIGGTVDDYMGVGITLDNPVSVDTTFFVNVFYSQSGTICGVNELTQSFGVEVLAGQTNGEVDACVGGQFFQNGATICSTCVTDYTGNTIDNIDLAFWNCAI
jgi:hypothetical protein